MKKMIVLIWFFACLSLPGLAQSKSKNAWGYAQGGIGGDGRDAAAFIGVGAEGVMRKGVGGGVQYWFAERLGWRAEFREYIFASGKRNFHNLRFGLCFR
jgi:hypothetical protein